MPANVWPRGNIFFAENAGCERKGQQALCLNPLFQFGPGPFKGVTNVAGPFPLRVIGRGFVRDAEG